MPSTKYRAKTMERSLTLTSVEVADILGISEYLVRAMEERGELPSIRLGKLVRFPKAKIMQMLEGEPEPKQTK